MHDAAQQRAQTWHDVAAAAPRAAEEALATARRTAMRVLDGGAARSRVVQLVTVRAVLPGSGHEPIVLEVVHGCEAARLGAAHRDGGEAAAMAAVAVAAPARLGAALLRSFDRRRACDGLLGLFTPS